MTDKGREQLMNKVLKEYLSCGLIALALDRSKVQRGTHHHWCKRYPSYQARLLETKLQLSVERESEV